MRCRFATPDGATLEGELLYISDGWFTVLPDGYAASNQLTLQRLIEAWQEPLVSTPKQETP